MGHATVAKWQAITTPCQRCVRAASKLLAVGAPLAGHRTPDWANGRPDRGLVTGGKCHATIAMLGIGRSKVGIGSAQPYDCRRQVMLRCCMWRLN